VKKVLAFFFSESIFLFVGEKAVLKKQTEVEL